jgi:hypothetical protein
MHMNVAVLGLKAFHSCCVTLTTHVDPLKVQLPICSQYNLSWLLSIVYNNPIYPIDFIFQIFSFHATMYGLLPPCGNK